MMVRLFRQFSLASLVAIVLAALALTLFYRHVAVENLIANRIEANDNLTQVIRNDLTATAERFVVDSLALAPVRLQEHGDFARVDAAARRLAARSAIAKIKIYNLDGMTVYSTEFAQIGEDRRAHPRFLSALAGRATNELVRRQSFTAHDGVLHDATLVGSYAPMQVGEGPGSVLGVFETYTDVTGVVAAIERTVWAIASGSVACLTLLYLTLLLVVRRAERRIHAQEAELRQMAMNDPLTGLHNRLQFRNDLTQAVRSADRQKTSLALLLLDLDGFKEINDSLGHAAGDRLLVAVARRLGRLQAGLRCLARLGGDEFVLMVSGRLDDAALDAAGDAVHAAFRDPFHLDDVEFTLSCSVGIAVYPDAVPDPGRLLKSADIAMYQAKSAGRSRSCIYHAEMSDRAEERFRMANRLRGAIARDELAVHYQPRVHASQGRIVCLEALSRWSSPEFGAVPPDVFIGLAEEVGLVGTIDEWVLDSACAQLARWRAEGLTQLSMAVNVSPVNFGRDDFPDVVAATLARHGLDAAALEIEVTEGAFVPAGGTEIETIRRISATGVAIAIDDFGTRHASLAHLNRFPICCLKIDKSFLRDTPSDAHACAIVQSIATLARALNLRLVAEGVETAEQLRFVRELGCDQYQGFHFSRALPPDVLHARFLVPTTEAAVPDQGDAPLPAAIPAASAVTAA